jgi:hypothetical protein
MSVAKRAQILHSVYEVLESHTALTSFMEHVQGANSVESGARIVADTIHLEQLRLPMIIFGFNSGDAIAPARESHEWQLECVLYADDVFQLAELLDLTEEACRNLGKIQPQPPLRSIKPGAHQRLEQDMPMSRGVISCRLMITVHWIS